MKSQKATKLVKESALVFASGKVQFPEELTQQIIALDPYRKVHIQTNAISKDYLKTSGMLINNNSSVLKANKSDVSNCNKAQIHNCLQEFSANINKFLWHSNEVLTGKYKLLKRIISHNRKVYDAQVVERSRYNSQVTQSVLLPENLITDPCPDSRKTPSFKANRKSVPKLLGRSRVIIRSKLKQEDGSADFSGEKARDKDSSDHHNNLLARISNRCRTSALNVKLQYADPKFAPKIFIDSKDCVQSEPVFRQNGILISANERIFVVGGVNSDSKESLKTKICELEYKESSNNRLWKEINAEQAPTSRYGFSLNAIDHKIYMFGGSTWNKSSISSAMSNDLYTYNLNSRQWSLVKRIGKTPKPCRYHASCVDSGNLLIHGGISEQQSSDYLSTLSVYDTKTKCWESYQNCVPVEFNGQGIAYHSIFPLFENIIGSSYEKFMRQGIYLFGGKSSDGTVNQSLYMAKLDSHNTSPGSKKYKVEEWVKLRIQGKGPTGAYRCTLVFVPEYNGIFVMGGYDKQEQSIKQLFMLRLDCLRWEKVQCLERFSQWNASSKLYCHSGAYSKGRLYIFGGFDTYQGYGKTRVLHLQRKDQCWQRTCSQIKSRKNLNRPQKFR